jgi:hypothetical protein
MQLQPHGGLSAQLLRFKGWEHTVEVIGRHKKRPQVLGHRLVSSKAGTRSLLLDRMPLQSVDDGGQNILLDIRVIASEVQGLQCPVAKKGVIQS